VVRHSHVVHQWLYHVLLNSL